jgi:hypothetical protein
MLTLNFKNQLLGPWDTAKGYLVAELERLLAGLRDPNAFLQGITTDAITGATTVPQIDTLQDQITAIQALLGRQYMPRPDKRRVGALVISGAATPASGFADFGMQGVLTSVNYNNTTADVNSWWAEYRTTNVIGNVANISWGNPAITWTLAEHLPIVRWHIKTGADISSCRIWAGIMDTIPSPGSDTQAGQDGILFRYSTVANDPGWMGFASKSLGGNAFSITSGAVAPIVANTIYDLQIRVESVIAAGDARVWFSVNGGQEVLLTRDVPIIAQYAGFGMSPVLEIETRAAATRSIYVSRGFWEAN